MTLEETINFIKKGSYSELEDIDLIRIVDFLEELQLSRKALYLAAEDISEICDSKVSISECMECPIYCKCGYFEQGNDWYEFYLVKARKEVC